jgi:hypothetical protein
MPSVTCMDWLHWLYIHVAHVASSSKVLAFLTDMNEKCKSLSSNAIQAKNHQNTITIMIN